MITERSATAVTAVANEPLLFARFGSETAEPTEALSVIVPACDWAWAITVRVAFDPVLIEGPLHDVTGEHVNPPPVALTRVPPLILNVIVGLTVSGPELVTVTAYVAFEAAGTLDGPLTATDRSAEPLTVTLAEALLLVGTGSLVVEDALAVLVIVPAAFAVSTNVIVSVLPILRLLIVQVTGPVPEQVVPAVEVTEANVPPEKVSLTVIELAGLGPLLPMTMVNVADWLLAIDGGEAV